VNIGDDSGEERDGEENALCLWLPQSFPPLLHSARVLPILPLTW
jgi:hypothetical protein